MRQVYRGDSFIAYSVGSYWKILQFRNTVNVTVSQLVSVDSVIVKRKNILNIFGVVYHFVFYLLALAYQEYCLFTISHIQ